MTTRKLLFAALAGAAAFTGSHLLAPAIAHAQSGTNGAVQGVIVDEKGGKLAGVGARSYSVKPG